MKVIFSLLLILSVQFCFSQNDNQVKIISIGIGRPYFTDKEIDQRNVSLNVRYQHRLLKAFSYDLYYMYAQSNNYPTFRNDPNRVDAFLMSQTDWNIVWNSLWSEVYSHFLGAKLHFAFANNEKWYVSANFATGIHSTKSSLHLVEEWNYDHSTGEMLSYENSYLNDITTGWFTAPGLSVSRTVSHNVILPKIKTIG